MAHQETYTDVAPPLAAATVLDIVVVVATAAAAVLGIAMVSSSMFRNSIPHRSPWSRRHWAEHYHYRYRYRNCYLYR